jgi:mRNA deadenylase 3'-5' endonuclease subunit Ccr4
VWLKKFKAAVVQRDIALIDKLLSDIPEFNSVEDMKEARYLTEEAILVAEALKNETAVSMAQMKKNIDFLNVTKRDKHSRFDITS